MTSERLFNSFIPPPKKKTIPPKQISGYAPASFPPMHTTLLLKRSVVCIGGRLSLVGHRMPTTPHSSEQKKIKSLHIQRYTVTEVGWAGTAVPTRELWGAKRQWIYDIIAMQWLGKD